MKEIVTEGTKNYSFDFRRISFFFNKEKSAINPLTIHLNLLMIVTND